MRAKLRAVAVVLMALLGVVLMGIASAFTAALTWAATVLIVPGTGTPNANVVAGYKENARDYYIVPNVASCQTTCTPLTGINYPASFWPLGFPPFPSSWCPGLSCDTWNVSVAQGVNTLDTNLQPLLANGQQVVVFGYSQGARVVTIEKINIANSANPPNPNLLSFVFIGNISRPNGGLFSRMSFLPTIPILNVTTGQPTPTNTPYQTTDIAIRWDGVADFPLYPLNLLAVANALLGFQYVHGTYLAPNANSDPGELPGGYSQAQWQDMMNNPQNYPDIVQVQQFGDTKYITVTPVVLPLVQPLHMVPLIGTPIADLLEPALRVIIEQTGYNRSIPFGQPTTFQLIPIFNPIQLAVDLVPAVVQGVSNFLGDLGGLAPLSTPFAPTTIAPPAPSTLAAARTVGTEAATADTHSVTLSAVAPDAKPTETAATNTDKAQDKTAGVSEPKTTTDTGSPATTPAATTPTTKTAPVATKPRLPKVWSRIGSDWSQDTKQKSSPTGVLDNPPAKTSPTGGTDTTGPSSNGTPTEGGSPSTGGGSATGSGSPAGSGSANAA